MIWKIWDQVLSFVPHSVGVYGAPETGKTTLDLQLTTQGEVRPLGSKDRTEHVMSPITKRYMQPVSTLKRVKSDGVRRVFSSRDLGGNIEYHNLWMRDMWERKVSTVVVIVDNRHLLDPKNTDNQTALSYIVESLRTMQKPKGLGIRHLFRKKYHPKRLILLANKADLWLNTKDEFELWKRGAIIKHELFEPFRESLYRLQEMNIPVRVDACSASIGWNVDEAIFRGMMDL